MKDVTKQQLNLTVNRDVVERARDLKINISEITEKMLMAFTTSSKTADKEKLNEKYQELFNLMLPLLKKFRVNLWVGTEEVWEEEAEGFGPIYDDEGEVIDYDPGPPSDVFSIYLESDGTLSHDREGTKDIKDIEINQFFKPQHIVDQLLTSILRGVEYRKNQFKEIEMAKTIIDAITKGIVSKSIKSERRKKK